MSISVIELINIATGIERRGIAFYDTMSRSTENESVRDIFHLLADMERKHLLLFQDMLKEANKFQKPETRTGENPAYLQALTDSAVFTDDLIDSQLAIQADSDIGAVEMAIGAEKDSILFYYEMKDKVPRQAQHTLNRIIAEEKSHLGQLSEIRKNLNRGF